MPTLRSRQDFERLQQHGRTRSDRLMLVRFAPNDLGTDRYGIATSRRVGRAVTRNRVRRRLREILRSALAVEGGWDVLVIARPPSAEATFVELRTVLTRLLADLRTSEQVPEPR